MKKLYLITTLFTIILSASYAQQWNWAKDVGRLSGNAEKIVTKTNDAGDLFTTGTFFNTATLGDTTFYSDSTYYWNRGNYVARLNSANQLIWAQHIGGQNTYMLDLSIDQNNNTYALGYFAGDLLLSDTSIYDTSGTYVKFLVAFNPSGSRKWTKVYLNEANFGNYIVNDGNNDLISANASSNLSTITVRKISPQTGNDLWLNTLSSNASAIRGLKCNSQNEIYLSGVFAGDTLKINNTIHYQDTGYISSSFFAKFNTSGALQGVEIIRGANTTDFGFDSQNNLYMIGSYEKKIMIRQVSMVADTCIPNNCTEFFMAKLNTSGTTSWARKMKEQGFWQGNIEVAQNGDFYYSGSFYDSVRFNNVTLTELEQRAAVFIYKFDTNGISEWAQKDEGGYLTSVFTYDLAFSESKSVYLCGRFQNYYDRNWFGTDTLPFTGIYSHIFLARLTDGQITSYSNVTKEVSSFDVFPNPTEGIFTLNFNTSSTGAKVCVYDMLGQCVIKNVNVNRSMQMDLSTQPKGIYLIEVLSDNKKMLRKIAIQ